MPQQQAVLKKKVKNFIATKEKPEPHQMPDGTMACQNPVQCMDCKGWLRSFKFGKSIKVMKNEHMHDTEPDEEEVSWHYQCAECHSKENGTTLEVAITTIAAQGSRWDRKRSADFLQARASIQEEFPFLCTSSKQVRMLSRGSFLKLFAPWGALIQAKRAQLTEHSEYVQELDVLMKRVQEVMTSGGTEAEINNLLNQITAMEEKIHHVGRMLAFREHAPEVQDQFLQAAEFEDEWIEWGGFRLRSWYKCYCGLVYSSKNWKRLHGGIHAKGQRYYCRGKKCNGKKYNQNFGQLVEFRMNDGSIHFSYAPMPPKDVEDLRARSIQLARNPSTPKTLFSSIVQFMPTEGSGIIRKATAQDFWNPWTSDVDEVLKYTCHITPEGQQLLSKLPLFNWMQIVNMTPDA